MTAEEQASYDEIMKRGRERRRCGQVAPPRSGGVGVREVKDHTDAVLRPPVDQQLGGGPISVATQT